MVRDSPEALHCVLNLSMSKTLSPVLSTGVQLWKTGNRPDMSEKLLTGT